VLVGPRRYPEGGVLVVEGEPFVPALGVETEGLAEQHALGRRHEFQGHGAHARHRRQWR
jgi:hypothetical protein